MIDAERREGDVEEEGAGGATAPFGRSQWPHRLRTAIATLYFFSASAYLSWRSIWTLHTDDPWFATLFFVCESAAVVGFLAFILLVTGRDRRPARPATSFPTLTVAVDVFVLTCNEPRSLLRWTILAARRLTGQPRVWICDDGKRPEIAELARELNVGYLARGDRRDFKAGNINHALERTSAEFVLILDADHVVRSDFLSLTLPYFSDPRVAFVQTPQIYYNTDSFEHFGATNGGRRWTESLLFHHKVQPALDRRNAAFCVGTGAVFRRHALEEVGGFASETITEDILTSMRLHRRGWRSVYVNLPLGFLLAPRSPLAYARQRLRWSRGAMQILRSECPVRGPGLSRQQRLFYFHILVNYLLAFPDLFLRLAPGFMVLYDWTPLHAPGMGSIAWISLHLSFSYVTFKVTAHPHGRVIGVQAFKMFDIPIFIRASWVLFRPRSLRFQVTPKGTHRGLPWGVLLAVGALFLWNSWSAIVGLQDWFRGDRPASYVAIAIGFSVLFAASAAMILWKAWRLRVVDGDPGIPLEIPVLAGTEDLTIVGRVTHLAGDWVHGVVGWPTTEGLHFVAGESIVPLPAVTFTSAERSGLRNFKVGVASLSATARASLLQEVFDRVLPRRFRPFGPPDPGGAEAAVGSDTGRGDGGR